jgi:hypothetical protein
LTKKDEVSRLKDEKIDMYPNARPGHLTYLPETPATKRLIVGAISNFILHTLSFILQLCCGLIIVVFTKKYSGFYQK